MPIEKDIIYIKLENSPLVIECNARQSMGGDGIYHEIESFVKVNVRLFVKAFRNNVIFISCNKAVGILFDAKHSFVAHYILPQSRGN